MCVCVPHASYPRACVDTETGGRDTMIASNTGSGKTLAYMLPLVHTLKEYEENLRDRLQSNARAAQQDHDDDIDPSMYRARRRRPRALILGPTRELVTQVFHVAKSLSHYSKFRASLVVGGTTTIRSQQRRRSNSKKKQTQALELPADVVVATPGRLLELVEDYSIILDDLLFVVVDEADTMFDQGFGNEVKKIMNKIKLAREERMTALRNHAAEAATTSSEMCASDAIFMVHNKMDSANLEVHGGVKSKNGGANAQWPIRPATAHSKMCQGAFVTATLTSSVSQLMASFFPNMVTAKTDALHRSAPNAKHNFIPLYLNNRGVGGGGGGDKGDLGGAMDRMSLLKNLVDTDVQKGIRTVVFCNTMECCRAVEHELRDGGIPTACYHGGVPARQRVAELASFSPGPASAAAAPSSRTTPTMLDDDDDEGKEEEGTKNASVLVCTDLAARGLDYNCVVDHVIMFDFPLTAVDYLHRSGRTARAGRSGTITSFVASKRDAKLANEIEETIRRGQPLDDIHFSGGPPKSSSKVSRKKAANSTTTTTTTLRTGRKKHATSSQAPAGKSARKGDQRGIRVRGQKKKVIPLNLSGGTKQKSRTGTVRGRDSKRRSGVKPYDTMPEPRRRARQR